MHPSPTGELCQIVYITWPVDVRYNYTVCSAYHVPSGEGAGNGGQHNH